MYKRLKKSISIIMLTVFITLNFSQCCYGESKKIPLRVDAVSAIAIDSISGRVLFEQNGYSLLPIASTTKIVTALVALNYGKLDSEFTVSKNAASIRGSKVGYKENEKITLHELLYGLMFKSGNDAAITIAEGIGGSIEGFCKLMNEYCLEIGMINSNFESPHGLDSKNHYSTAYDLAIATKKAKEIPTFNEIVSSKVVPANKYNFTREYQNINKLLYQMPNANGVKTGYTGGAGKCLVSSVNKGEGDIIIVTLNCTPRWEETKKIFNYVDENYEYKKIASKDEILDTVKIKDGTEDLEVKLKKDIVLPVKKDEKINMNINLPTSVIYPIKENDVVGSLIISNENGELLYEQLVSNKDINEKSFYEKLKDKMANDQ